MLPSSDQTAAPGWLPSECLAGFNRNRWLVSIGIDGWLRRNPQDDEAFRNNPARKRNRHVRVDARRLGRIRIQKCVDDSLPDGRVPGSVRQMLAETTKPTNPSYSPNQPDAMS
jgi:hypothetical protein